MYKTFGLLLLCVQLIIGSPETEELKHNCLNDEGFSSNVKICSIKDDIAIFEFVEQSMTFRCISILWTSKDVNDTQRILKIKPAFEIYYVSSVFN